jgi:hypothetical protein
MRETLQLSELKSNPFKKEIQGGHIDPLTLRLIDKLQKRSNATGKFLIGALARLAYKPEFVASVEPVVPRVK